MRRAIASGATASGGETMAPKHEADRPGKAQQPMGRRGDGDRGEHDAADRQERDRAQVEAELLPAHLHRVPVDDRRQHEQQDEIGRELQRRQSGDQGEPNAGDHQENGGRNLQSFRDDGRPTEMTAKSRIRI